MLTSESSKVSISVLPPRKFPRSKMLNLGVLRYEYVEGKFFWTAPISDGLPQFAVC